MKLDKFSIQVFRKDPFLILASALAICLVGGLLAIYFTKPESRVGEREMNGILIVSGLLAFSLVLSLASLGSRVVMALSTGSQAASIDPIDPLTKLPDRSLLADRLAMAIEHAKRFEHEVVLLTLDVDRFKRINDTYGHSIGDMVLVEISQRLIASTRAMDSVIRNTDPNGKASISRVAGDEFMILLSQIEQTGDIVIIAERILKSINQPILIGDLNLSVGANLGISIFPTDASNAESLIKNSDMALITAKNDSSKFYCFYDESIGRGFDERRELEKDLRFAISNEQLMILFQPKIQPVSGEIVGAEALVRWNHPRLGVLSPDKFIDILKDTRLIQPMTEWILKNSCSLLVYLKEAGIKPITIAVNLSGTESFSDASIESMVEIINQHGLAPNLFEFEMTEDTFFDNEETMVAALVKIKERGFQVAIDDFGTGFAALKYLILFPIDTIKIDKSFIQHIHVDVKSLFIVKSITTLCKDLKIEVVAEGVERYEQLQLLTQLECDQIQGYFVSKPINSQELIHWIKENRIFKYS